MSSLGQHLYEYKRGVRKLVLHTAKTDRRGHIEAKLRREGISFIIIDISESKINVFFGDRACVDIVRNIDKPRLADYTAEEDFLLGAMLGYDLVKQCGRYLKKKERRIDRVATQTSRNKKRSNDNDHRFVLQHHEWRHETGGREHSDGFRRRIHRDSRH